MGAVEPHFTAEVVHRDGGHENDRRFRAFIPALVPEFDSSIAVRFKVDIRQDHSISKSPSPPNGFLSRLNPVNLDSIDRRLKGEGDEGLHPEVIFDDECFLGGTLEYGVELAHALSSPTLQFPRCLGSISMRHESRGGIQKPVCTQWVKMVFADKGG